MRAKLKPWTPEEDAKLRRLYCKELQSLLLIERELRRGRTNIAERIRDLALRRSEAAFERATAERRAAGVAKNMTTQPSLVPTLRKERRDEHWQICRDHGGFDVLHIAYPPRRAA